jgi:hypothetical protein
MGKNPKPELHVDACEILLEARDLIVRGWSHGAAARDGGGRAVDPLHPAARSWSLAGALEAAAARAAQGSGGETEARAQAIAAAALATAVESEASADESLHSLALAICELTPPEERRAHGEKAGPNGRRAAQETRRARLAKETACCGVCRRELAQEGLHLISGGQMLGSFCSPPCLAAAQALVGLQRWAAELDAHGRRDEAEAKEALGDDLLLLWRRRAGPDPKAVVKAVQLARERDARRANSLGPR